MDFAQRMKEVAASLFGRGARTLERTAEGLESAAEELRSGAAPDEGSQRRVTVIKRNAATPITELADGTVREIRARLDSLSVSELRELREVEEASKNRKTLLAAIDRALAESGD